MNAPNLLTVLCYVLYVANLLLLFLLQPYRGRLWTLPPSMSVYVCMYVPHQGYPTMPRLWRKTATIARLMVSPYCLTRTCFTLDFIQSILSLAQILYGVFKAWISFFLVCFLLGFRNYQGVHDSGRFKVRLFYELLSISI